MRILIWDNSFKRAFKRFIRKNPQLKEKIFEILNTQREELVSLKETYGSVVTPSQLAAAQR